MMDFSDDLREDEAIRASEARVIGALQLHGIHIDMDGCLDLDDKLAQLFRDREQAQASLESHPEVDPDITDEWGQMRNFRNEARVVDRKIAIVTRAGDLAAAIHFEIDENDEGQYDNYPISSAASESEQQELLEPLSGLVEPSLIGRDEASGQGVLRPFTNQNDEVMNYCVQKHIAELAVDPDIILDDRRAFLAAIESLVGTETYQRLLHDIFRTDGGDSPHTIHI